MANKKKKSKKRNAKSAMVIEIKDIKFRLNYSKGTNVRCCAKKEASRKAARRKVSKDDRE